MKELKPDWSKPPIANESPNFKFPDIDDMLLSNGIRLICIEDDTQATTELKFISDTGSYNETVPGTVDVAAQLLTRGTKTKTATEIFDMSESLGASIKAFSSWNNTSISVSGLSKYADKFLDMMTDCMFNSSFEEAEFARIISKQTSDIQQNNADTNYLAQIALNFAMFKSHPYGHSRSGTENSIKQITLKSCKQWYDNRFKNSQIIAIATGNFNKVELIERLEKFEHNIDTRSDSYNTVPEISNNYIIIDKKDAPQSTLRIGFPTINKDHEDYPTLMLANTIFGGYFMSRLNHNLRETKGYTYGINSQISARKGASNLIIHSNIGNQYIGESISEIKKEMERFVLDGISDEELNRARQFSLGSFVRSYETIGQQAMMLSNIAVFDLDTDYYSKFFESISHISKADIHEIIERYFQPKGMIVVAAGDRGELEKQLEPFGSINIYNSEGETVL